MKAILQRQQATSQPPDKAQSRPVQRRCACGGVVGPEGECAACRRKRLAIQRASAGASGPAAAPPIVAEVLRSPGQPLDSTARAVMEPRFGHDFSQVRVHTDARASDSAQAVNALAYTVGRNIVFRAGEYAPATVAGSRLLAHELTHVVQQGFGNTALRRTEDTEAQAQSDTPVMASGEAHHAEAEAEAVSRGSSPRMISRSPYGLFKADGGGQAQPPQPVAPVAPNQQQTTAIESARSAAAIRAQVALMRLRGIVPPGPPGRYDPAEAMRQRARSLARKMFEWENPNMDQIEEIVGSMVSHLGNPQVMVAGRNDPECGNRAAYVRGLRPPIVLCPTFFSDTPEQQTRTMIHEAAHLARIGSAGLGESYCVIFDCETSCGGFDSADSWAQFIHCLSGQAPDQPTVIQGQPGGSGQQPGSGGTP